MAENYELVEGPQFHQKEMEAITFAVFQVSQYFYSEWQEDLNDLEKQLHAEEFRDLLMKLAPYSIGFQSKLLEVAQTIEELPEEEREALFAEAESRHKGSLDGLFDGIEE
jgi:hypothetical protein